MIEGELLKRWVKKKGLKAHEVASILGILRQSVYNVYKDKVLAMEYRKKLDEHGFNIDEEVKTSKNSQEESNENELFYLRSQVEILKKYIVLLEEKVENPPSDKKIIEEKKEQASPKSKINK